MGYIVSGGVIYSGGGGGGGGSTTFSGLTDVVIDSATLASGQVPVYNAATNKWENADVTAPSNLTDLGDVNITSPSNGQIVRYDATSGKFIASDEQTGDYVAVSQILSTGTKIAGIIVDGTETEVFAPTPPSISITQIQSTGTKIATITVDSSDVDIYAPEGGGSGGHTILDDSGTALTQRSNMQFKGAYSEDNSTDGITEVNVIRNMTKAEFDLLTDDEKQGIINITDITSGSDDRFQPVIYSEDEREIGVWTDGKPLYQKTFDLGSDNYIKYDAWTDMRISATTYDKIVGCFIVNTGGTTYPLMASKQNDYVYCLACRSGNDVTGRYITLQYTKTADTAGSGTWTPQGVPAVHYSTDEQVIGTWIDGSTLYEKTIDFGALPNNTTKSVNHNISNLDKVAFLNGIAYKSGDIIPIPFSHSSNVSNQPQLSIGSTTVNIRTANDQLDRIGYITIRYTKSST